MRLLKALPARRRKSLLKLIPVAALTGLVDVIVVGIVSRLFTVFIGQANQPPLPFQNFIPEDPKTKVISLVAIYIAMNWFASFSKLFLKAAQERLRVAIWQDLSELAQNKLLYQPYDFFLNKKKSDLSSKVLINISRVSEFLVRPILQISSGLCVITFICIAVLFIAKSIALYLIISLLIFYIFISLFVTPFIRYSSRQRIKLEKETNNILTESMRTIIDVHLTSSESYFEKRYKSAGKNSFPFIWKAEVLPEFPRSLIEPFGITLIFAIGLFPYITGENESILIEIVPFLATIAVAALKLTPPLQDSFRALTSMRASIPDLEEILKLIELPSNRLTKRSIGVPTKKGIEPRNNIKLENLSYKYPNSFEYTLKSINLTIPVGSRIAFVGETGSGKTTAANQLLCLLRPTHGNLLLDGVEVTENEVPAWQDCCSYVPQSIALLNSNIIENIAYGLDEELIDKERVWDALKAAQLAELVSEMPMDLYTPIGENGIMLSGGQRQRLAIARAFYRQSKFLVLDEATSALDNRTEAEVMDAIEIIGRRCTIITIAHRLSTIERSDCIYEFKNGKIIASGNYQQLLKKSKTFSEMVEIAKRKHKSNI
ncbi:ABC transporter ATP-binding protein [Prochlorococcus marinus]|uniref:ABC transporter ATP-binding protein n=1 Tax=Prochlorococcus marinus TaxID=1219 RepID=UPI0028FCD829|nr:ABC transporter ATP-binding protein [Prochlorococcus marinus]